MKQTHACSCNRSAGTKFLAVTAPLVLAKRCVRVPLRPQYLFFQKRGATGFTLVEALIALVVLSLLMLVLTNAVRGVGQTEEGIERSVTATDDYRLASNWLRDTLSVASMRRYTNTVAGAPAQMPFFIGTPTQTTWIGVLPARFMVGGRHYLRLAVESNALVLRYAPWNGAAVFTDWDSAQSLTLAAPVTDLALRYQSAATGNWSTSWPPPGMPAQTPANLMLPSAMRIDLDGAVPAWPLLVVSVRSAQSCSDEPQASFGGGAAPENSC